MIECLRLLIAKVEGSELMKEKNKGKIHRAEMSGESNLKTKEKDQKKQTHMERSENNSVTESEYLEDKEKFYEITKEVKCAIRQGILNEEVLKNVYLLNDKVSKHAERFRAEDEFSYLKSKNLIAEIYDYSGQIEESKNLIGKEGDEIYNQLPEEIHSSLPLRELKLIREKIRFCLNYSQAVYYRYHKYQDAKNIINKCLDLVLNKLHNEKKFTNIVV